MTDRRWIVVLLIAIFFFAGSFFFFLGSFLVLVSSEWLRPPRGDVAVVEVLGGLYDPKPLVEELRELREEKSVRAVVLRVDSPGGTVGASQEIHESVKELKKENPVVVSMRTVAASGGYYISAPASRIVANPGTVTGSIGVRMETLNVEDLLRWARVKPQTLKSGRWKDAGSSTRSMTPDEREYLEGILRAMHRQFKEAVAEGRGMTAEEVESVADGRVFTGREAMERKLVDEMGTLESAVEVAGRLAGIEGEPEPFYPSRKGRRIREYLEGATERLVLRLMESRRMPVFLFSGAI